VKVALAQFIYESNTFNPKETELTSFQNHGVWLTNAAEIREWAESNRSQMSGSLDALAAVNHETHPCFVAVCGSPGGRLSRDCYDEIRTTLLQRIQHVLPADILILHLHGAVCAEGVDDVEGELLTAIRQNLSYTGRIVVSLDLHANITTTMLARADFVTGYRTFPHQDFYETGERATNFCHESRPTYRTIAQIPAIIPPTAVTHRSGGFADILTQARAGESDEQIIDISLFPVQPWLDIEDLGTSIVVTSTDPEIGSRVAQDLAERWFAQREDWHSGLLDWSTITQRLSKPDGLPWMLVDTADATTGGSDGSSAEAIIQLWPHRHELAGEVLLWVVDPAAVRRAQTEETTFKLGQQEFEISAEVTSTGLCQFSPRGLAYQEQVFSCGEATVLSAGKLHIVITQEGCLCADPAFYECLGLSPSNALAVHVKSPTGWQAGYQVGAERGLKFDGPGCTSLNFARLPFTGPRRDLFPLNPEPPSPIKLWQSI
jgi:microcystin degradation protein MlrC